jgi:hypothetical protein
LAGRSRRRTAGRTEEDGMAKALDGVKREYWWPKHNEADRPGEFEIGVLRTDGLIGIVSNGKRYSFSAAVIDAARRQANKRFMNFVVVPFVE